LELEQKIRTDGLTNAAQLVENLSREADLLLPRLELFCRTVTH